MCARKIPLGSGKGGGIGGDIRKPSFLIMLALVILSVVAVLLGVAGYLYYDTVISRNMPLFFCLLPSAALAAASLASALLLNRLQIRRVEPGDRFPITRDDVRLSPEVVEKRKKETIGNMRGKRDETAKFLMEIEEQYADGLLSERTYATLTKDYTVQLKVIEGILTQLAVEGGGGSSGGGGGGSGGKGSSGVKGGMGRKRKTRPPNGRE